MALKDGEKWRGVGRQESAGSGLSELKKVGRVRKPPYFLSSGIFWNSVLKRNNRHEINDEQHERTEIKPCCNPIQRIDARAGSQSNGGWRCCAQRVCRPDPRATIAHRLIAYRIKIRFKGGRNIRKCHEVPRQVKDRNHQETNLSGLDFPVLCGNAFNVSRQFVTENRIAYIKAPHHGRYNGEKLSQPRHDTNIGHDKLFLPKLERMNTDLVRHDGERLIADASIQRNLKSGFTRGSALYPRILWRTRLGGLARCS